MDQFLYRIDGKSILVYRSVYAPVKSNMYVILTGREAVVFDPNINKELLELLNNRHIDKVHVLLTHEHYDHTTGVNWLRKFVNLSVYCQIDGAKVLESEKGSSPALVAFVLNREDKKDGGHRYRDFKQNYRQEKIPVDITFEKEDNFKIRDLSFKVTSTPGHCPGSACYLMNGRIVFTGDTLLKDVPVITRFQESNEAIYKEVTLPYLQSLDKKLIVMPGHGDPFVLSDTNNV